MTQGCDLGKISMMHILSGLYRLPTRNKHLISARNYLDKRFPSFFATRNPSSVIHDAEPAQPALWTLMGRRKGSEPSLRTTGLDEASQTAEKLIARIRRDEQLGKGEMTPASLEKDSHIVAEVTHMGLLGCEGCYHSVKARNHTREC